MDNKRSRLAWITVTAMALVLSGCGDGDGGGGGDAGHTVGIQAIGAEQTIAPVDSAHPSLALDAQKQLHVALDMDRGVDLFLYHKVGNAWQGGQFAHAVPGGTYDASRLYIPTLAIDRAGHSFIGAKFGNKGGGDYLGQVLFYFDTLTATEPAWFRTAEMKEAGCIALVDPFVPDSVVMMATDGRWQRYDLGGQVIGAGQLVLGETGEKFRAKIAPRSGREGVWHLVMGGFSALDGQYQTQVRQAAGLSSVAWASKDRYPEQGEDFHHPNLEPDAVDPELCYIAVYFDNGICVNIFDGTRMMFDIANLPVLDAAGIIGVERMGPALAAVPGGGAYVAWTTNNRIKMRLVRPNGSFEPPLTEAPLDICDGSRVGLCADADGTMHMVYNLNGSTKYRQITLETD